MTNRLLDPMPVTYAFNPLLFSLAFIRNMRSGGMLVPVFATTVSSLSTSAACVFVSGSNLLNSGSLISGSGNTRARMKGREASHKQRPESRRGDAHHPHENKD